MERLLRLHDPAYVASFQRFCGVELVKPGTCDQETQTQAVKNGTCGKQTQTTNKNSLENEKENYVLNGSANHLTKVKLKPSADHQNQANGVLTQRIQNGDVKERNDNNNNDKIESFSNTTTNVCNGVTKSEENHVSNGVNSCNSNGNVNTMTMNCKVGDEWMNTPNTSEIKLTHETKNTTPAYTVKYKSLLYIAHFGAFLGNEMCFLTFFPFCVWNFDSLIVRHIALLWGLVMYVGQAGKDCLRWRRPPCPPVVRLEFSYLQEFSMPSTHAMAGTAIPLCMASLCVERYQVPVPVAVAVALAWFACTCFSRLFLGVHSILDLLAGVVLALLLYASFVAYIEDYDLYQQTHRFAPVMVMGTAFALCTFCYPNKHRISSKGDAVQIVSSVAGFSIGFWMLYQFGYSQIPVEPKSALSWPTLNWVILSALRFGTGTFVLGAFYVPMKPATIRFFSYLYGLEKPDKTNSSVVTSYKFVVYFSIGILVSFFIPFLHVWLGICREDFFYEVV